MGKVSPISASLEGFRIIGKHPGALVVWALFYIVLLIVTIVAFFVTLGPSFLEMAKTMGANAATDPSAMMRMFGNMMLGFLIAMPILIFGAVMLNAAAYRAVLKPDDKGVGYLKIGADELRMFVVALVLGVLLLVLYLIVVFVGIAVIAAAGRSPVATAIYGLLVLCLFAWLGIKLSLAMVMTYQEKKIRIFESWTFTNGHFWGLLGMYALVLLFLIILIVGSWFIQMQIQHMMGLPSMMPWGKLATPIATPSPGAAITGGLIGLVVSLIQVVVQVALLNGPQAAAYRNIVGTLGTDAAKAF